MSNLIVEVEEGKLQGKVNKTANNFEFFTFKGIPYAKPPVGDLRFSIPTEPEPWDGVRDATKDCNSCAQFDHATHLIVGVEDCLYLNVYTPKLHKDGSPLPVMAYINGGGFTYGHVTDVSPLDPDFLVEKNVVVVSINYRIGILGFLCLDLKDAPGNMGLRDQVQALKWVQKNIVAFGGDPKNVTIFGVSAGGCSVEYLLLSRQAKGLFHKAIAQSGSTLMPWAYNTKIKELAYKIPPIKKKSISSDEQLLEFFKNLSTKELLTLVKAVLVRNTFRGGIHFGFVPTVEKPGDWEPFLDEKPYDLLSKGEFIKVPFIVGFCAREGLVMRTTTTRVEKVLKENNFLEFLPFEIDDNEREYIDNKLKKIYFEGKQLDVDESSLNIDFFGDVDFISGSCVSASLIAKHNSSVYIYVFAYDGNLNYLKKMLDINLRGACHGDELGYLLNSRLLLEEKLTETDKLVRNRLVKMWTNFAINGDPTPHATELLPTKWEPTTSIGLAYLHIDDELEIKREWHAGKIKLFEELYKKYDLSS